MTQMNGYVNGHATATAQARLKVANGGPAEAPHSGRHEHRRPHVNEEAPFHIVLLCYFSYVVLIAFGYLRDFLRKTGLEKNQSAVEANREAYVPLYQSFESFYTRNIYRRICDAWNMPICSVPGALIRIIDRVSDDYNWNFRTTGAITEAINMGSYNYLGFAQNSGPILDSVERTLGHYGVGLCSTSHELGTTDALRRLEAQTARYLGVEASIIFGMGFATNATNIHSIATKGCLIMSDELNHASLILGCRISGATIRVFRHNGQSHPTKALSNPCFRQI